MLSEARAGAEAAELEKVLTAALKTNNPDIVAFCKQHIAPLYNSAVGESYGSHKEDSEVKRTFGDQVSGIEALQPPK